MPVSMTLTLADAAIRAKHFDRTSVSCHYLTSGRVSSARRLAGSDGRHTRHFGPVEVVALIADGDNVVLAAAGYHDQSAMRTTGDVFDPIVGRIGVRTATASKVQLARMLEIDSAACGASEVSPFAHERLDDCIAFHWAILTGAAVRFASILSEMPMG